VTAAAALAGLSRQEKVALLADLERADEQERERLRQAGRARQRDRILDDRRADLTGRIAAVREWVEALEGGERLLLARGAENEAGPEGETARERSDRLDRLAEARRLLDEVRAGSPHPNLGGLPGTLAVLEVPVPRSRAARDGLRRSRARLAGLEEELAGLD